MKSDTLHQPLVPFTAWESWMIPRHYMLVVREEILQRNFLLKAAQRVRIAYFTVCPTFTLRPEKILLILSNKNNKNATWVTRQRIEGVLSPSSGDKHC